MTDLFVDLGNRASAVVQEALGRRCEVCHAGPGVDCTNIVNGYPLQCRIVHYARTSV